MPKAGGFVREGPSAENSLLIFTSVNITYHLHARKSPQAKILPDMKRGRCSVKQSKI